MFVEFSLESPRCTLCWNICSAFLEKQRRFKWKWCGLSVGGWWGRGAGSKLKLCAKKPPWWNNCYLPLAFTHKRLCKETRRCKFKLVNCQVCCELGYNGFSLSVTEKVIAVLLAPPTHEPSVIKMQIFALCVLWSEKHVIHVTVTSAASSDIRTRLRRSYIIWYNWLHFNDSFKLNTHVSQTFQTWGSTFYIQILNHDISTS